MKLIKTATELSAAIAKIGKAGLSLDAAIQTVLASSVYFAVKDGNTEPLTSLFTTLSKGTRRAAVQAWVVDHAPVILNTDKSTAKEKPFVFHRAKVEALTGHAQPDAEASELYAIKVGGIEWTAYKPEQLVPEQFDVQAMLATMVKRAKDLQSKGSKPVHGDLIAKLEAMVTTPTPEVAPL